MYGAQDRRTLGAALAAAFLAGPWDEPGLIARGAEALRPRPRWLRRVARVVLEHYHRPPTDRPRELASFVEFALERDGRGQGSPPHVRRWFVWEPAMAPRRPWPVPELDSVADLAVFLELSVGDLAWLADARSLERRVPARALRNYSYVWLARPGGPPRVIERPKARLKAAQRRILRRILDPIPPHGAAHGFRRGRSTRGHAAAHTGRRVVLRFDLEDFFASVPAGRVYGIYRTAGYPEAVAHALTALATNVVPLDEWWRVPHPREPWLVAPHHRLGRRLATPHLPQGAPTSPALANLSALALDRRLAGLAAALDARYTRYADDLVLSGGQGLLRAAGEVRRTVADIAREEGHRVNERKGRLMTSAGRQRVGGIVVNERLNVSRAEYDRLKAILHNAARHGPAGQNRAGVGDFRAHLLGRIAWVRSLHPARGARLMERFERVDWG